MLISYVLDEGRQAVVTEII